MPSLALKLLPWPLPAVLAWLAAWAVFRAGGATGPAFAAAALLGSVLAFTAAGRWRRALVAAGFPLSALALGGLPAWAWLLLLLPLLLAYPVRAWRDAPFFPTSADALRGLDTAIPLRPGAKVLDAGCGVGHALAALHGLWPQACLHGIEWSRPLAWLAARRCRWANVVRGDMWAASWAGFDVIYVFQRPESMARVVDKACREAPGAWLVSLEFEATELRPHARIGGRPLWVYRIPSSTKPVERR